MHSLCIAYINVAKIALDFCKDIISNNTIGIRDE